LPTPSRNFRPSQRGAAPSIAEQLHQRALAIEATGQDILYLQVGQPSTGAPAGCLEALQEAAAAIERMNQAGLDCSVMKVAFYSQLPDPFDDAAYEKLLRNFRQAARFAKMAGFRMIAVDTEADSLFHFREKICLIQLAGGTATAVVDPLHIDDFGAMQALFENPAVVKVLHGADYDVRSLYRDFGIRIDNLFDTELAGRFLGTAHTGLEAMLRERLNIRLNKKFQKKDWSQRPLPPEMVAYAAEDVNHLVRLARILMQELENKGRLEWVRYECRRLSRVTPACTGDQVSMEARTM